MTDRFFATQVTGGVARLDGDEAHHLARVRRLARGDHVRLFDGTGVEYEAVIETVRKGEVLLTVLGGEAVSRELAFSLTLVCTPPKGDRLRWLVEKATELGVTRFTPLVSERASERAHGVRPERLRRWVVEASKQCGRNVLMEVTESLAADTCWRAFPAAALRLVADPAGGPLPAIQPGGPAGGVVIAIGPEGGFTASEVELARSCGWSVVGLGPRTLRIETAALALVASLTASHVR